MRAPTSEMSKLLAIPARKSRTSWKFPSPTLDEPSMRNPMFTEL